MDAGISRKAAFERMHQAGEDPEALDAILITHEHSDHVSCLGPIARRIRNGKVPIYLTDHTARTIAWEAFQPELREFSAGSSFSIGGIAIQSFTIPHDAVDPVGFCFRAEGLEVGLATDLGYIPDSVRYHLRGTDFLILESNHDIEMLKVGPYPWPVKQRVMGRKGHLSNDLASEFILEALASSTRTLVLGHLSEQNNHPEIVRVTAQQALDRRALGTRLVVAEPRRPSMVFELE